jgi:hypothetical protein
MIKAIGTWLLRLLGKCAQALLRLALFVIGTSLQILGKTVEKLGQEIIILGK